MNDDQFNRRIARGARIGRKISIGPAIAFSFGIVLILGGLEYAAEHFFRKGG